MPADLLEKVLATQTFNQGFATTEYLAASLLDQAWHQITAGEVPDAGRHRGVRGGSARSGGRLPRRGAAPVPQHLLLAHLEQRLLGRLLLLHLERSTDADSVEWFKETAGSRARTAITSARRSSRRAGASRRSTSNRAFRGAEPDVRPLLIRRGLTLTHRARASWHRRSPFAFPRLRVHHRRPWRAPAAAARLVRPGLRQP